MRRWIVYFGLVVAGSGTAGTLHWGPTGQGGPGAWDLTSMDWFDGATAVTWIEESTAVFGGVVEVTDNFRVQGLQFDVGGYVLTSATYFAELEPAAVTFTIDAQADTRLDVEVNAIGTPGDTWAKNGPARLVMAEEVSFFDELRVADVSSAVESSSDVFTWTPVGASERSLVDRHDGTEAVEELVPGPVEDREEDLYLLRLVVQ